jgi:hypothetical protein
MHALPIGAAMSLGAEHGGKLGHKSRLSVATLRLGDHAGDATHRQQGTKKRGAGGFGDRRDRLARPLGATAWRDRSAQAIGHGAAASQVERRA